MKNKFIIFTMGRTGSSYLCDLLNSHSKIDCYYEIYKDHPKTPDEDDLSYIDSKLSQSKNEVSGFKLLHHQVNQEVHDLIASSNDFKKILLIRKNPIDRFVSLKLAEKTGVWHLDHQLNPDVVERGIMDIFLFKYSVSEIIEKFKNTVLALKNRFFYRPDLVVIDVNELKEAYDYENQYHESIKKMSKNDLHVVFYEDLCERQEETLSLLLSFLGLKILGENLISSRMKMDDLPLNLRIENYNELKEQLADHELKMFL